MTRVVDLQISGNRVYYKLNGCTDDEFVNIINYKSWLFKSWKYGTERKYFSFIYINRPNEKVIWSFVGYAPVLIRYLQSIGYLINGKEQFRSKEISVSSTLYQPYDFQDNAISSWITFGCCGVIKSPTGCLTGDSLIYTNKGLITIKELYNKRYKDIKVMNYKSDEIQYNKIDTYYHYKDKEILYIKSRLGFEIRCTPEHRFLGFDDNEELGFIEARNLKIGSIVSISFGLNEIAGYDSIICMEKRKNEDVYDLTIKNVPSYIANGFNVHNSGKSFTACKIIEKMKVKTLITVHTNDLLINAWMNTLTEQFGENIKNQIGIIGGKLSKKDRKNMRIMADTSYEANIKQDIVIATSQSLLNKLNLLSNEKFGLLVVDEVHHYPSEQFSKVVNNVRAPYRLGLSATLIRSDGATPLIWGLLGDICFKISIRELVNKKVLVNPVFNTIVIDDKKIQSEIATCGLTQLDLSRYVKQMSASSVVKANYILNLVESLCRNGKKFVMYTDFVNSENSSVFTRDFYVQELNKRRIRVIGVSADMTGNERSRVFTMLENGKLDGLVFGLLGSEGVNIPKIDSVVMCNGTKSTIRYTQRVGRSMRVVKTDINKVNAFIYEVILNTPMENKWSNANFFEYESEGYKKERIYVK